MTAGMSGDTSTPRASTIWRAAVPLRAVSGRSSCGSGPGFCSPCSPRPSGPRGCGSFWADSDLRRLLRFLRLSCLGFHPFRPFVEVGVQRVRLRRGHAERNERHQNDDDGSGEFRAGEDAAVGRGGIIRQCVAPGPDEDRNSEQQEEKRGHKVVQSGRIDHPQCEERTGHAAEEREVEAHRHVGRILFRRTDLPQIERACKIRRQNHHRGDRKHRVPGVAGEVDYDHRQLHDQAGDEERNARHAAGVLPFEDAREGAVHRRRIGNLGDHDGEGEPAGEQRNDHSRVHHVARPGAVNHILQQRCSRRIGERGQLRLIHPAEGEDRKQCVDHQTAEKSDQRRLADVALTARPAGNHHRAFDADECPQRHHHRRLHLLEHTAERADVKLGNRFAAGHVGREEGPAEGEEHDDDEESDRNQFADRADRVDEGRLPHAGQYGEIHDPDHQ